MSAGFKVADEVFWGTNGAVESYIEEMAAEADARFGADDPLTEFLAEQRDSFSSGRVVFLDDWVKDAAGRKRFLAVLDAATDRLLQGDVFTEHGREWVAYVVSALRARISEGAELVLRSPRLCLRRLRSDDATAIVGYRSLPEVARFQSWESFGPADAERLIAEQAEVRPDTPGTWLQLALVLLESGEVIGDCGIHFRQDEPRQVELGITLAPAHQGRGLATEALRGVLGYVFDTLDKHRASAVTDADNHAAASLFRRLGFRQEGHLVEHVWYKGGWGSEYVFGLLRREWHNSE